MRALILGAAALALMSQSAWAGPCAHAGQELCLQGYAYVCKSQGGQLAPVFHNRACAAAFTLEGVWKGVARQNPPGPNGADYPVIMTLTASGGSIVYPKLDCGGALAKISGGATSAAYRETITYGNCVSGGQVNVSAFRGDLSWSWTGSYQGAGIYVTGVLKRQP